MDSGVGSTLGSFGNSGARERKRSLILLASSSSCSFSMERMTLRVGRSMGVKRWRCSCQARVLLRRKSRSLSFHCDSTASILATMGLSLRTSRWFLEPTILLRIHLIITAVVLGVCASTPRFVRRCGIVAQAQGLGKCARAKSVSREAWCAQRGGASARAGGLCSLRVN